MPLVVGKEHQVEVEQEQGKHQVEVERELGTQVVVVGVAYLLLVAVHQVVVEGKLQVVVAEEGTHLVVAALQVVEEQPVVLQEQTLVVVEFQELVDTQVVPFVVYFSRIEKQKHSRSSSDTKRW